MPLTDLVAPNAIIPALKVNNKKQVLQELAARAAALTGQNEKTIFDTLMQREKLGSTAVGNGIAIPHCFTDEVPDLLITVARSRTGLEFDSFDGKPTQVVFLLMGNRQEHSLHLKALARIARLIKSTSFIEKIVASSTVEGMVSAFEKEEAKI